VIERARAAGGTVERRDGRLAVHVAAAVTHTLGGLRVDERARVLRDDGTPIEGLFAAGVDAGGISTGGYSSGLATALVLGRIAAEQGLA
jgi:predicted oxidoreductase